MIDSIVTVREAQEQDRRALSNLFHFEARVHRHLDWRPPLDWLGVRPCLLGEIEKDVCSALVCPPEPPEVAWIRLFAVASTLRVEQAWEALWPTAQEQLARLCSSRLTVAAIPTEPWFCQVLEAHGFIHRQNIVSLHWNVGQKQFPSTPAVKIRPMMPGDLPEVATLDAEAFAPLWQNSPDALAYAYRQAVQATVAIDGGRIVGYQISTGGPFGGHLARLAVLPGCQGRGIGRALVRDALAQFTQDGVSRVSVNTQQDNSASLRLYQEIGFRMTGEIFTVYCYNGSKVEV
ncbi:MAG: GNAT family N-acetyltransferase [Chloroflexota bacterium]